jgi:hypothetical protein
MARSAVHYGRRQTHSQHTDVLARRATATECRVCCKPWCTPTSDHAKHLRPHRDHAEEKSNRRQRQCLLDHSPNHDYLPSLRTKEELFTYCSFCQGPRAGFRPNRQEGALEYFPRGRVMRQADVLTNAVLTTRGQFVLATLGNASEPLTDPQGTLSRKSLRSSDPTVASYHLQRAPNIIIV